MNPGSRTSVNRCPDRKHRAGLAIETGCMSRHQSVSPRTSTAALRDRGGPRQDVRGCGRFRRQNCNERFAVTDRQRQPLQWCFRGGDVAPDGNTVALGAIRYYQRKQRAAAICFDLVDRRDDARIATSRRDFSSGLFNPTAAMFRPTLSRRPRHAGGRHQRAAEIAADHGLAKHNGAPSAR